MTRKKYLLFALLLTFLFSLPFFLLMRTTGWAGDVKGKVVKLRDGKLERLTEGEWKQLSKGSKVFPGDRLRTDKSALAVVELPDIGRITIGPDSEIELGKDPKDFKSQMPRGSLYFNAKLPEGSRASITTSLATAGIRGTKFSVLFDGKTLDICTCTGEVEVVLKDGKVIEVPTASFIDVTAGAPPPEKAISSIPMLETKGTSFDFCFNCHIVGGKGRVKRYWE